jgi:hypothetical protein
MKRVMTHLCMKYSNVSALRESWTPVIEWWLIYRYFNVVVEHNIYPLASILGLSAKTCISRSTYSTWSDPRAFPNLLLPYQTDVEITHSCGIRRHRDPMPSCAVMLTYIRNNFWWCCYVKTSKPLRSSWHLRKHAAKLWQLANARRLALHDKPVRLLELCALGEYLACYGHQGNSYSAAAEQE